MRKATREHPAIRGTEAKPAWRKYIRGGEAAGARTQVLEAISRSPEETHRFGIEIARHMPVPGVLLLHGALGSGKTTLTRGIAEGLGLSSGSQVNSPSYTLVNIYQGRCAIYHVDLYRLSDEKDIRSIGLDDFIGRDGVTIVEWGERLRYPRGSVVEVELTGVGDENRKLRVTFPSDAGVRHIGANRARLAQGRDGL